MSQITAVPPVPAPSAKEDSKVANAGRAARG